MRMLHVTEQHLRDAGIILEKCPHVYRLIQHVPEMLNVQHDRVIGKIASDTPWFPLRYICNPKAGHCTQHQPLWRLVLCPDITNHTR